MFTLGSSSSPSCLSKLLLQFVLMLLTPGFAPRFQDLFQLTEQGLPSHSPARRKSDEVRDNTHPSPSPEPAPLLPALSGAATCSCCCCCSASDVLLLTLNQTLLFLHQQVEMVGLDKCIPGTRSNNCVAELALP